MTTENEDYLSETWPKEFSELKELEKLLRCNICKDFMKTSLITGCSHLFCSYCIRQSIIYRNQCPACFMELYDNQLRPERTLDEVIRIFTSVKSKLLKRLRISYAACPSEESNNKDPEVLQPPSSTNTIPPSQFAPPSTPSTSTSNVLLFNSPLKSQAVNNTPVLKRTVPSIFSPSVSKTKPTQVSPSSKPSTEPSVKTVPCPVCNVEISERNINLHLDDCLSRAGGAPPKSQPQNKPSRKPKPKLVLSLMKEKELKQYCKEYGLSLLGDRKALMTRIQRYTVLYNSECDSLQPRSEQDIIRQIEKEEKSTSNNTTKTSLFSQITRKTDPKVIEEANTKYLQDNKSAFNKLIENMRQREGKIMCSPRPTASKIISDDEDDVDDPMPTVTDKRDNKRSDKSNPCSVPSTSYFSIRTPNKQSDHLESSSPEHQIPNPPLSRSRSPSSSPNIFSSNKKAATNPPTSLSRSSSSSPDIFKSNKKTTIKTPTRSPDPISGCSPDLFIPYEEEELCEAEELCTSPNLLAGAARISPPKFSQISEDGHFLSDTESETAATAVKRDLTNRFESPCKNNQTVFKTPQKTSSPPLSVEVDSDEDNFLQLVQNRKGKRKSKDIVLFSPKATRSKKIRKT